MKLSRKVNLQFTVTAHMDFQIIPKIFRFQSKYTVPWTHPLKQSNSGQGPGDLELDHSHPGLSTGLKSE